MSRLLGAMGWSEENFRIKNRKYNFYFKKMSCVVIKWLEGSGTARDQWQLGLVAICSVQVFFDLNFDFDVGEVLFISGLVIGSGVSGSLQVELSYCGIQFIVGQS